MLFTMLRSLLDAELKPYISSDDDYRAAAASSMLQSFGKKYMDKLPGSPSSDDRCNTALDRFRDVNRICGFHNALVSVLLHNLSPIHREILGESRRKLYGWLARLDSAYTDPRRVTLNMVTGPGVCLGSDGLSLYTKAFESAMPCPSEGAVYLWNISIQGQTALNAESQRASTHGLPYVHSSAKWSNVPKTTETDRSIVISSNGGAMLQRSIGIDLERILALLGYDIATQPDRNRDLARIGSMYSGHHDEMWMPATIDLSDASDTLYYELIRYLLGDVPNVFKALNLTRESQVQFPDGTCEKLHMFSTMGCGFTFPLQTLIFLSFAEVILEMMGRPRHLVGDARFAHQVGVFGDDIIVPNCVFELMIGFLKEIGLRPNPSKSFNDGWFRESCGSDWYRGRDIRGVYCKTLQSPDDRVSLFNRLVDWSSRHDIHITYTLRCLWNHISGDRKNPVPMWESVSSGICVPSMVLKPQRTTLRRLIHSSPGARLYRKYVAKANIERPSVGPYELVQNQRRLVIDGPVHDPKPLMWKVMCPDGIVLSLTRSTLDKGGFPIRMDRKATSLTGWCSTLNWDYSSIDILSIGGTTTNDWLLNIQRKRITANAEYWRLYMARYASVLCRATGELLF